MNLLLAQKCLRILSLSTTYQCQRRPFVNITSTQITLNWAWIAWSACSVALHCLSPLQGTDVISTWTASARASYRNTYWAWRHAQRHTGIGHGMRLAFVAQFFLSSFFLVFISLILEILFFFVLIYLRVRACFLSCFLFLSLFIKMTFYQCHNAP